MPIATRRDMSIVRPAQWEIVKCDGTLGLRCSQPLLFRLGGWVVFWFLAGIPSTLAQNPIPLVNQPLVPASRTLGGPGFALTVNGTGFVSGAVVNWNGSGRVTTFASNSQLTAAILSSDIAAAGTALITATNPAPGGGISNVVYFQITSSTPSISLALKDYAAGNFPYSVTTGDFNRDGKLDPATANYSAGTISILLGNGDGTFQANVDYAAGAGATSVITGDFNSEGKLDLAVGQQSNPGTVSILLGTGDGTFQAKVDYAAGGTPAARGATRSG